MNFTDIRLDDLIPHRGRMKLIHSIIETDTEKAVTKAVVSDKWPLFDGNGVLSLLLIEVAAQTAGVCNGLDRIKNCGIYTSKTGWLVGIKKAQFFIDMIPNHTEIITFAENSYKFDNFREIKGTSKINSDVVSKIVLQLFRPD